MMTIMDEAIMIMTDRFTDHCACMCVESSCGAKDPCGDNK